MFMCAQCLEQYEDESLAYTMILESRTSHPAADAFVMRFCSKAHLQDFLTRSMGQGQKYVLTKVTKSGEQRFTAATPHDLLLLVGSSQG